MKKILLYFAIGLILVHWACEDRDDNLGAANIRINNVSALNFNRVQVGDSIAFENVTPDGFSEYKEFDMAFEEDVLIIETDSATYNFEPSETFEALPIGLYTYELDITEDGSVDFTFKID